MSNVKNIAYDKEFYHTKRTYIKNRTSLDREIQKHHFSYNRSLIEKSQNQNINLKKYYKSAAE